MKLPFEMAELVAISHSMSPKRKQAESKALYTVHCTRCGLSGTGNKDPEDSGDRGALYAVSVKIVSDFPDFWQEP